MIDMPARNAGMAPEIGDRNPRSEDEEVDFVFFPPPTSIALTERINSLAASVDKWNVAKIEGRSQKVPVNVRGMSFEMHLVVD